MNKEGYWFIFLTSILLFFSLTIKATKIIRVIDGDTFISQQCSLLYCDDQVRNRLARIDSPEIDSNDGERCKAIAVLLLNGDVSIDVVDIGYYGRSISEVTIDGDNMSDVMVSQDCGTYY